MVKHLCEQYTHG